MVICPRCGWNHVRRSRRKGLLDLLAALCLLAPYRCHDCRRRFYDFFWFRASERHGEHRLARAAEAGARAQS